MDQKTLKRLADNKEDLYKKLPKGKGEADLISTKIWGILYPDQIPKDTNLASSFVMSIIDSKSNIQTRTYNQEIGKILKSTGRALEYFLIDYLQRNKSNKNLHENPSKINHWKGTFEQDMEDKIDFLSTLSLFQENKIKHITSGIQLTTTDSPYHKNHVTDDEEKKFNNKKEIVKKTDTQRSHLPRSYKPDIKGFMVVNGKIQETIHQNRSKIFSQSFRKRRKDGFKKGGPTQFLPKHFLQELAKVAKLYEWSQYHMIENANKTKKIKTIQETEDCYIHINYDNKKQEIKYEFFNKKQYNQNYSFIFSITYFLQ